MDNNNVDDGNQIGREFFLYGVFGVMNCAFHLVVFALLTMYFNQTISNTCAFIASTALSFLLNAKYTFKKSITVKRVIKMYVAMGAVSIGAGIVGDLFQLHFLITFLIDCFFSYVIGFLFSKFFVFEETNH